MSKVLIVYEEEVERSYKRLREQLSALWLERGLATEEVCIVNGGNPKEYNDKILAADVKYICTFDMSGFQLGTLLEQPAYNICVAKQMHIILREEYFRLYADNDFALNLFFYVPGSAAYWKKKYPHVLHFSGYEDFNLNSKNETQNRKDKKTLEGIVEEFLKEVEV